MAATSNTDYQAVPERFPWETPKPVGDFWTPLDAVRQHLGRQFLLVFTPAETAALPLDPRLSTRAKLELLYKITQDRVARDALGPPGTLTPDQYAQWRHQQYLLESLEEELELYDTAEAREHTLMAAYEARTDNVKKAPTDLGALSGLAWLKIKQGQYALAEMYARRFLPMAQSFSSLGPDSPQAVGGMRILIEALGRQGKFAEARRINEEGYRAVQSMTVGRFRKYAAEELQAMNEVRTNLAKWEAEAQR